jgi:hypothetical protein
MSLKESFAVLTNNFVDGILAAVHDATFADLASFSAALGTHVRAAVKHSDQPAPAPKARKAAPAPKSGRLIRRTPAQIAEAVNTVATLLRSHPAGLRSEQIRAELGMDVRELPRVLKEGVAQKTIHVLSGQKRATVYGSVTQAPKALPKVAKKAPAKKAGKKAPAKAAPRKAPKKAAKKAPKQPS